jgi:hypothetical protein
MTDARAARYCALSMDGWQSKAAFVEQFRAGTDVRAARVEGRVEHIASYRSARFHSVDELLAFVAGVLDECQDAGRDPAARGGHEGPQ